MKRITALLLALVLVFALAACGGPSGGETSAPETAAPGTTAPASEAPDNGGAAETTGLEGKKIGLMIYSTTTPWAINIIDTFQSLCDSLGVETVVAEAGTPADVVTGAENLLAADIDGMLCMMDGGIANKVMELCDAKGVYTSFTFTNILDADYYADVAASEYYAGSVNSQDYEASYAMTQHCIDLGADQWVFLGMPEGAGPSIDARATGFKACLEDNNLEMLSEARTFDKVEGAQNLITNFPQLNGFGSGLNAAKNASGALESAGKMGEVYMFCFEAAESYVQEYFDAGALHGCADGVVGHMELALAQLVNAMSGNKVVGSDGQAVGYSVPYLIAYDSDDFSTLIANSYDGNMIYSLDELKDMIVVYNADGADNLTAAIESYSIDDLLARRG